MRLPVVVATRKPEEDEAPEGEYDNAGRITHWPPWMERLRSELAFAEQPSPQAFLAYAETQERDATGKFGQGGGGAQTGDSAKAAETAKLLEESATSQDWGHPDGTGWGVTEDLNAATEAHYAAAATVGTDVATTVEQWSWGGGVTEVRDYYENYREHDGKIDSNADEFLGDTRMYAEQMERGSQEFFAMIDANRVDADLYRGQVSQNEDRIADLKVGETIPDGLASWSRDPEVAQVFRDQGMKYADTGVAIEMHLAPGAHGVDIATLGQPTFAWQKEVVVGGPLVVKSVEVIDVYPLPRYIVEVEPAT